MFPDDEILLARGRYSTLSHERREQLARFQKVAQTAMSAVNAALKESQDMPPSNPQALHSLEACLNSMKDARERIVPLCEQMIDLKPQAWE